MHLRRRGLLSSLLSARNLLSLWKKNMPAGRVAMYRETKFVIICCVLCAEQILSVPPPCTATHSASEHPLSLFTGTLSVQPPPIQPPTQLDIPSLSPRLHPLSNSPLYNYDKALLPVIAQPRTVLKPPTAVTTWYIAKCLVSRRTIQIHALGCPFWRAPAFQQHLGAPSQSPRRRNDPVQLPRPHVRRHRVRTGPCTSKRRNRLKTKEDGCSVPPCTSGCSSGS